MLNTILLIVALASDDLSQAAHDAARLGPLVASRTRYLSLHTVPIDQRDDALKVLTYWANSLSKKADFGVFRRVSPEVYAVNIDAFGWNAKVWDKLADEDPYYHVRLKVEAGSEGQFWYPADGKTKAGYYPAKAENAGTITALAPWLEPRTAAELIALAQSPAPILRADWWFSRVAIQADRQVGYYDFLEVKDRAAFEKLVFLDLKESQRAERERAGVVARSGVANFPRQIFRYQSITGGYWVTKDALDNNRDERNALRQTFERYKHQAEEHYGVLPNGLFAYFLSDDKGVRQDTAPDKIGADRTAPGNDPRIHVGLSCVRCHVEGIRPINDWSRRIFSVKSPYVSADPAEAEKYQRIYLGELAEHVNDDTDYYAKRLKKLTGTKPDEMAKLVGKFWQTYVEADLLPADSAAEVGIPEKEYLDKLRAYFRDQAPADPVLASHIADPPVPIRRDDWEQLVPLVVPIVKGIK